MCIIISGTFGGHACLGKNRDRNYIPRVKLIHGLVGDVEMLFLYDTKTRFVEGLNSYGIGIVNSALNVQEDEAEGRDDGRPKKPSRDGSRMLKALSYKTIDEASKSIMEYDKGLKGHTFISDGMRTYAVEMTKQHPARLMVFDMAQTEVRTNHGFMHPDAGYVKGQDRESSVRRMEQAIEYVRGVKEPGELMPTLFEHRMYKSDSPYNMVRNTDNMKTTSQSTLDLTAKKLYLYLIPGNVEFLGVETHLPNGYTPSLSYEIETYAHGLGATTASEHMHITSSDHAKSIALMKFLSGVARAAGAAEHVYIVGGAVRNYILNKPIKDIDVVIDSVALGGRDSAWFAKKIQDALPCPSNLATNNYGVAILTVKGPWELDGVDLSGEVIEIANARKESYSKGDKSEDAGKGYKPTVVEPATIQDDIYRREFTFNTLLWRLLDVANGPDKAEIIDLTGVGKQHLEERLIKTPMDPDTTFSDDPTRMLRAIKFLAKYKLKIAPDVAAAIRRNAPKMKKMPWNAIGTILTDNILEEPTARESLLIMKDLGLIDVLREMIQTEKPFASMMAGKSNTYGVQLLLDLADLGLPMKTPVSFLTKEQQARLREITVTMPEDEALAFLAALKTPPIDTMAIINEFQLPANQRGLLGTYTRDALLERPSLVHDIPTLQSVVRGRFLGGSTTAAIRELSTRLRSPQ